MIELDINPMEKWSGVKDRPLIIAGPCSAETEEQVMSVAKELTNHHVDIMRAGIWKPRTRPNSFEGVGEEYMECDPSQYHIDFLECTTDEGYAGVVEKICNKIQILYSNDVISQIVDKLSLSNYTLYTFELISKLTILDNSII